MRSPLLFSLVVGCATALSSSATVIYNSFGPGDSYSATGRILQGETVGTIGNVDQAASFTVGASDYVLTSISLGLDVLHGGNLDIILAADSSGTPGASLETIALSLVFGTSVRTGSASGTTVLSANTTYWVIADAKDKLEGAWNFNDQGITGTTAGRLAPVGTFNYGAWNSRLNDDQLAFRVEGREPGTSTPVPDGGSALALFGLSLFAVRRMARRA